MNFVHYGHGRSRYKASVDMILVVLDYGIALKKIDERIYVFDSHSRSNYGLCIENGSSIMVELNGDVYSICSFLRSLIRSLTCADLKEIEFNCQFLSVTEIERYYFFSKKEQIYILDNHDYNSTACTGLGSFEDAKIDKTYKKQGRKRKLDSNTSCDIITTFKKAVSCGPEYVCCCCIQTWFRHNVCRDSPAILKNIDESLLTYNAESQGKRWLCYCCYDV